MENSKLPEDNSQLLIEEWIKPEIKIISIEKNTFGHGPTGADAGDHSGTDCPC
jgi:hypothetical protein